MTVAPKRKTTPREKIGYLVCLLGTSERGERASAWSTLERLLRSEGFSWTDIGQAFGEDKYTETEMQQFAQAARAEGVEAGIKIGQARAKNGSGSGNGHLTLPPPGEMAEYCQQRLGQLKNDWQRDFVADLFVITRHTTHLTPGRLANLAKIYIEIGGKV